MVATLNITAIPAHVVVLEIPSQTRIVLILYFSLVTGPCSHSLGYSFYGSACYRLYNEKVNQSEAENKCQTHGGHLASVHSKEEHKFLKSLAQE